MIAQHTFGELLDTERIEAPVNGMPALEGIVGGYEYCVRAIVHYLCEITFRKEVLENFCATFHAAKKRH